jgi:hypothetical protein
MTKNGPMYFAQSWAVYMTKSNKIYGEEKKGVASHFSAYKMHVKELIGLAQSQCYGIGRERLI